MPGCRPGQRSGRASSAPAGGWARAASSRPARATCPSASTPTRLLVTPTGRRKDELTRTTCRRPARTPRRAAARRPGPRRRRTWRSTSRSTPPGPDVGAVAHAHLPASMALTLAGEVPDPAVLPETALSCRACPTCRSARWAARSWPSAIAAALSSRPSRSRRRPPRTPRRGRRRPDPTRRVDRLELVEVLCRTWRDALLIRAARATLRYGVAAHATTVA